LTVACQLFAVEILLLSRNRNRQSRSTSELFRTLPPKCPTTVPGCSGTCKPFLLLPLRRRAIQVFAIFATKLSANYGKT